MTIISVIYSFHFDGQIHNFVNLEKFVLVLTGERNCLVNQSLERVRMVQIDFLNSTEIRLPKLTFACSHGRNRLTDVLFEGKTLFE